MKTSLFVIKLPDNAAESTFKGFWVVNCDFKEKNQKQSNGWIQSILETVNRFTKQNTFVSGSEVLMNFEDVPLLKDEPSLALLSACQDMNSRLIPVQQDLKLGI